MDAPTLMRFHGFTLDIGRRTLTSGGRPVHLTRKAFDLLTMLVHAAPRVVPKDELHRGVWPETFVTDATVASVVKELRRALDDHDSTAPIVRTVRAVGYAFEAAIETAASASNGLQCLLIAGSQRIVLAEGINEIGRSAESAVWLEGSQVSRHHARITVRHGTAMIEDLGSSNLTLVNHAPIDRPTPLADGDSIQIGRTILLFRVSDAVLTTELADPGRSVQ